MNEQKDKLFANYDVMWSLLKAKPSQAMAKRKSNSRLHDIGKGNI